MPARLLVANSGADTVSVLDPDAHKSLATIQLGQHPTAVALAGPANKLPNAGEPEYYVTYSDADGVSVIDAGSLKAIATVPVSAGPITVVIPQTGGVAYVETCSGAMAAQSIYAVGDSGLYVSKDGGASFAPASGNVAFTAVAASPATPATAGALTGTAVYMSGDSGASLKQTGPISRQPSYLTVDPVSAATAYAGASYPIAVAATSNSGAPVGDHAIECQKRISHKTRTRRSDGER
jgi:YVTN family beta-propeller protein